ncbi:MAG TPA: hypothetical protein VF388_05230, partial [Lacunisphaera sp.]
MKHASQRGIVFGERGRKPLLVILSRAKDPSGGSPLALVANAFGFFARLRMTEFDDLRLFEADSRNSGLLPPGFQVRGHLQ